MSEKPAQARKRQASASLRAVASELNITGTRRSFDMSKIDFSSSLKDVLAQSSTQGVARKKQKLLSSDQQQFLYQRVTDALPSRPTKTVVS